MMPDTTAVRSRWLRRLRNVFVGVIAAVALIAALGFFAVPPLARTQIEKLATQALGRQVTLGHAGRAIARETNVICARQEAEK